MEAQALKERLAAPFAAGEVKERVGATTKDKKKGLALSYIDARTVMQRLDEVLGIGGWQDKYIADGDRIICELSVKVGGEWVTRSDGSALGGADKKMDSEDAYKTVVSDAFKRAAVKFGVGRYLYGLPSKWKEIDQYGQFVKGPRQQGAQPQPQPQPKQDRPLTAAEAEKFAAMVNEFSPRVAPDAIELVLEQAGVDLGGDQPILRSAAKRVRDELTQLWNESSTNQQEENNGT